MELVLSGGPADQMAPSPSVGLAECNTMLRSLLAAKPPSVTPRLSLFVSPLSAATELPPDNDNVLACLPQCGPALTTIADNALLVPPTKIKMGMVRHISALLAGGG